MAFLEVQTQGFKELLARFDQLTPIFEKEIGEAMTEAVRQFEDALEKTIPAGLRSPHLRSNISGTVTIGYRVVGTVHVGGFWASFVDRGTKPHDIRIGDKVVHHPGAKAVRFVAQARNMETPSILEEFDRATQRIADRLDH